jgi:ferredoxin
VAGTPWLLASASVSLDAPVRLVVVTISSAVTAWLIGSAVSSVAGNAKAPWLLGRAAGVSSYLLIVALVMLGLLLAHPAGTRLRRIPRTTLLHIHVSLAIFTLAFPVLHIVALATDDRLIVNPVACDGVGMCAALAPETVTLDPWGFPLIRAAPLNGASPAAAARAVAGCPRRALSLQ